MLSYMDQIAVCTPIREMIIRAVTQSDDVNIKRKANDVQTNESILRAVSLRPELHTKEQLKDFIIEHILEGLRLTDDQRVRINLNG